MMTADTDLNRFLQLMELERLDPDLFLGEPEGHGDRLYGGFVAAQAVVAVSRTVERGFIHSLHAYFLRLGNNEAPIRFVIQRVRNGRSFTTRNVVAYQSGEAIFDMAASFVVPEEGFAYQQRMPDVPAPEELPSNWNLRAVSAGEEIDDPQAWQDGRPIEVRAAVDLSALVDRDTPAEHRVWIRPRGTLPKDPVLHAALLAYATDETSVLGAARPKQLARGFGASLDHAVWFHRPPRFDDWILYTGSGVAAYANRPVALCSMYSRDGARIATVAQEELHRAPRT